MSLAEYEDFVFAAGLLNESDPVAGWRRMSETQQRLADYLNGKSDYHVVAANGTDVKSLEAEFIRIAKKFGENRGIGYGAWRDAGVPAVA